MCSHRQLLWASVQQRYMATSGSTEAPLRCTFMHHQVSPGKCTVTWFGQSRLSHSLSATADFCSDHGAMKTCTNSGDLGGHSHAHLQNGFIFLLWGGGRQGIMFPGVQGAFTKRMLPLCHVYLIVFKVSAVRSLLSWRHTIRISSQFTWDGICFGFRGH